MTRLHGARCHSGTAIATAWPWLVADQERSVQRRLDLLREEPVDRTAIEEPRQLIFGAGDLSWVWSGWVV
jgi:hypothetical protein